MPETSVDAAQIAALVTESSPESAGRLRDIAETTSDKDIRKAARRALYTLSQRGIVPASNETFASTGQAELTQDSLKVYASAYDGAGNRLLLLVLPDPDGGSPTLTQLLLNDELGIREFESRRMPRRNVALYIERFESELDLGLALAEIEGDYGRWLVAQTRAINQRRGTLTPVGFMDILPRIGEPKNAYKTSPIYAVWNAEEIKADASIPHDPQSFFGLPWFEPWFFAAEEVIPWLAAWEELDNSVIITSDSIKQERRESIVKEAVKGLFTFETQARYIVRLEESADILRRREKTAEARQALFQALDLETHRDVTESPFARVLTQRTIEAAIEMVRAARERQSQKQQE